MQTTHAKETRIKEEVKQMTSVFKCELCNKQYKTVKEHEQHLSSYDHHHKKVRAPSGDGDQALQYLMSACRLGRTLTAGSGLGRCKHGAGHGCVGHQRLIEMKDSMRESRSDIQKREERRAEKEMARYNDLCASQGQHAAASTASTADAAPLATALPDAEERPAVKLGFGFGAGRGSKAGGKRKPKLQPSVFQLEDSDE